jgi:uncharacterized protein YqgV (UPF0045/DUF77 family)
MLFDISVIPLGGDIHLSDELAGVLAVIDRSGLPYQLGPGSTCIAGEWDEAMPLILDCHRERGELKHVITLIKVEDDEGKRGNIHRPSSRSGKAGSSSETCGTQSSGPRPEKVDDEQWRRAAPRSRAVECGGGLRYVGGPESGPNHFQGSRLDPGGIAGACA